jgi:hypothetical protein
MAEQVKQAVEEAQGAIEVSFRLSPPSYADVPAAYSNFVQATLAQHDLTIFFSWYATPPLADEPPTESVDVPVRPVAAVSVPLGILRPLIRLLEQQAAVWEQSTGQKLPDKQAAKPAADKDDKDESE